MTTPLRRRASERPSVPIQGSWTAIPNSLLRDIDVPPGARLLCALLHVHAGNTGRAFPRQPALAALLGVNVRTVRTWSVLLEERGYVVRCRTLSGTVYELRDPSQILTNRIVGSESDRIVGSAQPDPTIRTDRILRSDPSTKLDSWDSDSSSSEGDDDRTSTIREEVNPTGALLRSVGIGAWRILQTELAHVPHELVERRVMHLVNQGKEPAIIVYSLRNLPFTPEVVDEAGPWTSSEYSDVFRRGDDEYPPDGAGPQVDRSDPAIRQFLEEAGL